MFARITIPSADRDGRLLTKAEISSTLHWAEEQLCNLYGGCTAWEGSGSWVNSHGELISEPVWIVESFADVAPDWDTLRGVAEIVRVRLNQESVAYAIGDGSMRFAEGE